MSNNHIEEKIYYGYISKNDLEEGFVPTIFFSTYSGARSAAKSESPAERPYYIVEITVHHEIVGEVKPRGINDKKGRTI